MSFQGFSNIDLSKIEDDERQTLPVFDIGRHTVVIEDAKINDSKKHDGRKELELTYKNNQGQLREWLIIYDPETVKDEDGKEQQKEYVNINWRKIKKMLTLMGHEANETPDVSWFHGKTIGINVKKHMYNGETQMRVNYHFMPPNVAGQDLDDKIPF